MHSVRPPTHEATTSLDRKLVDLIGQEETDALFTLLWEARGRPIIDVRQVYGRH